MLHLIFLTVINEMVPTAMLTSFLAIPRIYKRGISVCADLLLLTLAFWGVLGAAGCQYSIAECAALANAGIVTADHHRHFYAVRAVSRGITLCRLQGVVDCVTWRSPLHHHVFSNASVFYGSSTS